MIKFNCKKFEDLTVFELYEILALRAEVFCVEQNCPYQDMDGKDLQSWHNMGRDENGKLVVYTRLLPEGLSYIGYTSIGRVVNSPLVRGTGVGKILMQDSINKAIELFGNQPIKIGAQTYALGFYERLGFVSTGEEYLEDDIPHTKMVRKFS
jgi:ElaA protein